MYSSAEAKNVNIYFEGNSLMNHGSNGGPIGGHYVPTQAYLNIIPSVAYGVAMFSYAISGQTQAQINTAFPTRIDPVAKSNDIVFLWEGTNSLDVDGLSAAAAFAEVVTYIGLCKARGLRIVIGTVIARNGASDPADLMTRIDAYNVLVRNNAATYGYTVCDLGADAMFNQRADADISPPYATDKVHLLTAGQDNARAIIVSSILTIM